MWDGIVWFFDELGNFINSIWNDFLSSFALLIEAIPVPDFLANAGTLTLPSSVSYFASAFELQTGVAIITTAYIARFLIRRTPIIG